MTQSDCRKTLSEHRVMLRRWATFVLVLVPLGLWMLIAFAQGDKTWYKGDTTIGVIRGSSGRIVARMSALAGTIVDYDGEGKPNFIGFAKGPKGVIEGKYGITAKGPENSGRLVYKQEVAAVPMPYIVVGGNDIVSYWLKDLELTTASADGKVYGAYAVKAIAFDNTMENRAKQPNLTFKMPADGQLPIERGKIRFGDKLVTPNYDLTGKMP